MQIRDSRYDILKAFAIIIMVANHAQIPRCIAAFGNLFHMAVFFILAGWFFSPRHCESFRTCFVYWKARMVRLWWPCVFWSVVFILLRNILASHHLIHELSFWETASLDYNAPLWSVKEIMHHLLLAPLMLAGATPLAGAFWFLQALLFASVGYCVVNWILKTFRMPVLTLQTLIAVVFFVWNRQLDCKPLALIGGPHTLIAYALIHIGVLLRRYDLRIERLGSKWAIAVFLACLVTLIVMSRFGTISLAVNKYPNSLFLFVASVLGWYFLTYCSSLFRGKAATVLAYIGSHTMPILLFHYVSFKILNILLVICHNDPFAKAANVVSYVGGGYWLLYTIVGLGLPLLFSAAYSRLSFCR